jgi:anti-sigma factor RsiW
MKVCVRNRKRIAWLAAGVLDPEESRELLAHLESCEGCRGYFRGISGVVNQVKAGAATPEVEATEDFYKHWTARVKAAPRRSSWLGVCEQFRGLRLGWRLAVPALGAAALVLLLAVVFVQRPVVSPPVVRVQPAVPHIDSGELAPSFSNYKLVANQSLEKFDELLTRQAQRNPAGGQIYRASTLISGAE